MANDLGKLAGNFLNDEQAKKLSSKESDLMGLANTADGKKIRAIAEKDSANLEKAVQTGDLAGLQSTLKNILSTEEGVRLAKTLNDMMK